MSDSLDVLKRMINYRTVPDVAANSVVETELLGCAACEHFCFEEIVGVQDWGQCEASAFETNGDHICDNFEKYNDKA